MYIGNECAIIFQFVFSFNSASISFSELSNFSIMVDSLFFADFETDLKFVFLIVRFIEPSQDGIVKVNSVIGASGSNVGISFTVFLFADCLDIYGLF